MRRRRRWFLRESPEVLTMLRAQVAITLEGMDLLVAWAGGDATAVDRLRDCEHRADDRKRELREALGAAFTTPLEPEDIFELSSGVDRVLNGAKNAVREAEVMQTAPDPAMAELATALAAGARELAAALAALGRTVPSSPPRLQRVRRRARAGSNTSTGGMSSLIGVDDLRQIAAKRELYRRLAGIGDDLREVAE